MIIPQNTKKRLPEVVVWSENHPCKIVVIQERQPMENVDVQPLHGIVGRLKPTPVSRGATGVVSYPANVAI